MPPDKSTPFSCAPDNIGMRRLRLIVSASKGVGEVLMRSWA